MTSRNKKIRLALLLWHRRIGAVIALFLLLLAGSGLLLNHTSRLQLAQHTVTSDLLLRLYGIQTPQLLSFRSNDNWVSHLGGSYVYLNNKDVAYCEPPLRGVESVSGMVVIACHDVLILLTPAGEVIERIDQVFNLPRGLQTLAKLKDGLALKAGGRWYQVNVDQASFNPIDEVEEFLRVNPPTPAPADIKAALLRQFRGEEIHLERVLQDLHSGRLFGVSGVIWMDLVAVAMIWVAGSGVWVWLTRPKRPARRQ